MNDLSIRLATAADGPVLRTLASRLANFLAPAWRNAAEICDADARAMLEALERGDPDSEVFVAERSGEAAGCLHVLVARDFFGQVHAHISVVAVSAAAEGTGVGASLMTFAERWARGRGLPLITLNVFEANTRARRLYERSGFVVEFLKYAKPLE